MTKMHAHKISANIVSFSCSAISFSNHTQKHQIQTEDEGEFLLQALTGVLKSKPHPEQLLTFKLNTWMFKHEMCVL